MSDDTIAVIFGVIFFGAFLIIVGRAFYHFFSGLREGYRQAEPRIVTKKVTPRPAKIPRPVPENTTSLEQQKKEFKVFISYRRADSADVTGRIYDRLVNKFGKEAIFKDVDSIPLGVDYRKYLENIIGNSDIFLVVIGPDWEGKIDKETRHLGLSNDFVTIEVESALIRDVPVIPILVRGAQMPKENNLPERIHNLAFRNGTLIRPDPDFHKDVDRLISAIEIQKTI